MPGGDAAAWYGQRCCSYLPRRRRHICGLANARQDCCRLTCYWH
jgi:hypothetical protein